MTRTLLLVVLLTFGVAACGRPPQSGSNNGVPAVVGVYTSASDCAESEKLTLEECNALIDQALVEHRQRAKSYISMRLCEAGEGAEHCERSEDNTFRRRLQAFMITFSTPPTALGLYAGNDGTSPSFQTIDKKTTVLAVDETLQFSKDARFVAEGNLTAR